MIQIGDKCIPKVALRDWKGAGLKLVNIASPINLRLQTRLTCGNNDEIVVQEAEVDLYRDHSVPKFRQVEISNIKYQKDNNTKELLEKGTFEVTANFYCSGVIHNCSKDVEATPTRLVPARLFSRT